MLLDKEGGKTLKEGPTPLLNTLITGCSLIRIIKAGFRSFPEKERDTRGELKRGEASLI
jgi:hypothetical protein